MLSDDELAELYALRYDLSFKEGGISLDEYAEVIRDVLLRHQGYAIFKIDSERSKNIYTFVVTFFPVGGDVIRKDTSSTMIGMKAVFAGLEKLGRFGMKADDVRL
ncbi:MAG: hypothetical protein GAK28_03077 [Luteibacter sp.]|nr:MAG: hypothetical protein GAK28_03077 [Luteibacter sp.]